MFMFHKRSSGVFLLFSLFLMYYRCSINLDLVTFIYFCNIPCRNFFSKIGHLSCGSMGNIDRSCLTPTMKPFLVLSTLYRVIGDLGDIPVQQSGVYMSTFNADERFS
ncbi:hypothetical protein BDV23DRAFT_164439 [Aspergillus alliaceus]|uniref:Uncharacterized protein n=1 Tax=Petromyces alliaceus TaxID=209559 RepID=A0A5N7BVC5_PETAA|nr:hypothetical protein BDV23DRAFT_164439 [Aspergillus alliaceus]